MFKNLILEVSEKTQDGFRSTPENYAQFLGAEGTALSTLRPAGIGLFEGNRLSIVAEGEFIEPNSRIKVIKVEGYRIIVKKIS